MCLTASKSDNLRPPLSIKESTLFIQDVDRFMGLFREIQQILGVKAYKKRYKYTILGGEVEYLLSKIYESRNPGEVLDSNEYKSLKAANTSLSKTRKKLNPPTREELSALINRNRRKEVLEEWLETLPFR